MSKEPVLAVEGAIKVIGEEKTFGSNGFRKRDLVIETMEGQYAQVIAFEVVQNNCDLLDNFAEGQQVRVDFNIRGREWTSPQGEVKYFNSLQAWRITKEGQVPAGESAVDHYQDQQQDEQDDLPF